jgi:hypothetical protein
MEERPPPAARRYEMPRFDTSFNFGLNATKPKKPKAGKRKKARGGRSTSSKSRRYFAGLQGS